MRHAKILTLALLLGAAPAAHAATYYFAAAGAGSGTCQSAATPCQGAAQLNRIFATLQPGDQVLFQRGDRFNLSAVLALTRRHGSQAQPIVLGAYGTGTAPVLARPERPGDGQQILRVDRASWLVIQDLTFTGGKGAVVFRGTTHATLQRNTITSCYAPSGGGCVHVQEHEGTPSSHLTIRDNQFVTSVAAERIYIGTDPSKPTAPDLTHDILITNNLFRGNGSATHHECIEMKAGSQRVTIRGNTFLHPGTLTQNGCIFSSLGTAGFPAGHHVIEDNWIEGLQGPAGYGIRIRNAATIRRNTIIGGHPPGILLEQPGGHPHYQRLVEGNSITHTRPDGSAPPTRPPPAPPPVPITPPRAPACNLDLAWEYPQLLHPQTQYALQILLRISGQSLAREQGVVPLPSADCPLAVTPDGWQTICTCLCLAAGDYQLEVRAQHAGRISQSSNRLPLAFTPQVQCAAPLLFPGGPGPMPGPPLRPPSHVLAVPDGLPALSPERPPLVQVRATDLHLHPVGAIPATSIIPPIPLPMDGV